MFLFKYKCINCKYNISLRVNFYYRLTFLLKFKNAVNTFVRYFMHIFFSLCGLLCSSSSKLLQMTSQSLNTVYQIDLSVLFLIRARILCLLLHCLSVSRSPHNHLMSLDPSANILSSLYLIRRCVLSWNVYCWSHGMDGCMAVGVYSLM